MRSRLVQGRRAARPPVPPGRREPAGSGTPSSPRRPPAVASTAAPPRAPRPQPDPTGHLAQRPPTRQWWRAQPGRRLEKTRDTVTEAAGDARQIRSLWAAQFCLPSGPAMASRQEKVDLAATGTEPTARLSVHPATPVGQIFISVRGRTTAVRRPVTATDEGSNPSLGA